MSRIIRVLIAIMMVLVLVIAARGSAAWAADPAAGTDTTSPAQGGGLVSHDDDDDECDKPWNHNREKCREKDKDKDKDHCKHKKHGCGTVNPPGDEVEACKRGRYPIGGIVIIDVRKIRHDDCVRAHMRDYDPRRDRIPTKAGRVMSDVVSVRLPRRDSQVEVCFAVPPGKDVKIYFSSGGVFQPVKTKVKNGMACADAQKSGDYVLVGR